MNTNFSLLLFCLVFFSATQETLVGQTDRSTTSSYRPLGQKSKYDTTSIYPVGNYRNLRIVYRLSKRRGRIRKVFGCENLYGKQLIAPAYGKLSFFNKHGVAIAGNGNEKSKLIDSLGNTKIPPLYHDLRFITPSRLTGKIKNNVYFLDLNGQKSALIQGAVRSTVDKLSGTVKVTFPYGKEVHYDAYGKKLAENDSRPSLNYKHLYESVHEKATLPKGVRLIGFYDIGNTKLPFTKSFSKESLSLALITYQGYYYAYLIDDGKLIKMSFRWKESDGQKAIGEYNLLDIYSRYISEDLKTTLAFDSTGVTINFEGEIQELSSRASRKSPLNVKGIKLHLTAPIIPVPGTQPPIEESFLLFGTSGVGAQDRNGETLVPPVYTQVWAAKKRWFLVADSSYHYKYVNATGEEKELNYETAQLSQRQITEKKPPHIFFANLQTSSWLFSEGRIFPPLKYGKRALNSVLRFPDSLSHWQIIHDDKEASTTIIDINKIEAVYKIDGIANYVSHAKEHYFTTHNQHGHGIVDLNGKVILSNVYSNKIRSTQDLINNQRIFIASPLNKQGYHHYSYEGEQLTPRLAKGPLNFSKEKYILENTNEGYYLYRPDYSPINDQAYASFYHEPWTPRIKLASNETPAPKLAVVGNKKHYGVLDGDGQLILPIKHDSIRITSGGTQNFALLYNRRKGTVINIKTGETIIERFSHVLTSNDIRRIQWHTNSKVGSIQKKIGVPRLAAIIRKKQQLLILDDDGALIPLEQLPLDLPEEIYRILNVLY